MLVQRRILLNVWEIFHLNAIFSNFDRGLNKPIVERDKVVSEELFWKSNADAAEVLSKTTLFFSGGWVNSSIIWKTS